MTANDLHDWADRVASREELVAFAEALSSRIADGSLRIDNDCVDRYIEAFSGWLADSDGYYENVGIDAATVSPWARIAGSLLAALEYE